MNRNLGRQFVPDFAMNDAGNTADGGSAPPKRTSLPATKRRTARDVKITVRAEYGDPKRRAWLN